MNRYILILLLFTLFSISLCSELYNLNSIPTYKYYKLQDFSQVPYPPDFNQTSIVTHNHINTAFYTDLCKDAMTPGGNPVFFSPTNFNVNPVFFSGVSIRVPPGVVAYNNGTTFPFDVLCNHGTVYIKEAIKFNMVVLFPGSKLIWNNSITNTDEAFFTNKGSSDPLFGFAQGIISLGGEIELIGPDPLIKGVSLTDKTVFVGKDLSLPQGNFGASSYDSANGILNFDSPVPFGVGEVKIYQEPTWYFSGILHATGNSKVTVKNIRFRGLGTTSNEKYSDPLITIGNGTANLGNNQRDRASIFIEFCDDVTLDGLLFDEIYYVAPEPTLPPTPEPPELSEDPPISDSSEGTESAGRYDSLPRPASTRSAITISHSKVVLRNSVIESISGSNLLLQWGTELVYSSNNYFKNTGTNCTVDTTEPMDFGYECNSVYTTSPGFVSTDDYFVSPNSSIKYAYLENRDSLTGSYYDYSFMNGVYRLASSPFQSKILVNPIGYISTNGKPFMQISAPIEGGSFAFSDVDYPLDAQFSNSDLSFKGVDLRSPSLNLQGAYRNLEFTDCTVPDTFLVSSANFVSLSRTYISASNLPNSTQRHVGAPYTPFIILSTMYPKVLKFAPTAPLQLAIGYSYVFMVEVDKDADQCSFTGFGASDPHNFPMVATVDGTLACVFNYTATELYAGEPKVTISLASTDVLEIPLGPLHVFESLTFYEGWRLSNANPNSTFINQGTQKRWWVGCNEITNCTSSNVEANEALPSSVNFLSSGYRASDITKNATISFSVAPYTFAQLQLSFVYAYNSSIQLRDYLDSVLTLYVNDNLYYSIVLGTAPLSQVGAPSLALLALSANDQFTNLTIPIQVTDGTPIEVIRIDWIGDENVYLASASIYSNLEPVVLPEPPVNSSSSSASSSSSSLSSSSSSSSQQSSNEVIIPVVKAKSNLAVKIAVPISVVGGAAIIALILFICLKKKKRDQHIHLDTLSISPNTSSNKLSAGTGGTTGGGTGGTGTGAVQLGHSSSNIVFSSDVKLTPIKHIAPPSPSPSLSLSMGSLNIKPTSSNVSIREEKYRVHPDILAALQESRFYPFDNLDFPVTFSHTRLDFGLEGMKCQIDREFMEEFMINNLSKRPLNITIILPPSQSAVIYCSNTNFILKPGKSIPITLGVLLCCTTKFMEKFAVFIEDYGHTFLYIHLESVLSTKLDYSELEFFNPVGEGSFGVVYRGSWRGQDVAIKQMKVQNLNIDEVYREMDLMSKLRHSNIISFIGAVVDSENLCIVSEFIPIGSLGDILYKNHTKLTLVQKVRFALDVAKGCNFLHQCGIIHRDLKPDNILVVSLDPSAPICIKISDFGTSKETAVELDYSKYTSGVGTPIYMSNQILEKVEYDNTTDVYSYAVMFYELIIEEVPFSEIENMWDIPRFVISGKRPTKGLMNVDSEIVEIINQCWSQDAKQRPEFKDLIPRLERILERIFNDPAANTPSSRIEPEAPPTTTTNAPTTADVVEASDLIIPPTDSIV